MAAPPAPAVRVAISRDTLLRALRPAAAPATGAASTADLCTAVLRGTASPSERALLSSQLFAYQHTPSVDLVAQIGAWLASDVFAAKDVPLVAKAAAFETALEALISLMQPVDRLALREAARRVFLTHFSALVSEADLLLRSEIAKSIATMLPLAPSATTLAVALTKLSAASIIDRVFRQATVIAAEARTAKGVKEGSFREMLDEVLAFHESVSNVAFALGLVFTPQYIAREFSASVMSAANVQTLEKGLGDAVAKENLQWLSKAHVIISRNPVLSDAWTRIFPSRLSARLSPAPSTQELLSLGWELYKANLLTKNAQIFIGKHTSLVPGLVASFNAYLAAQDFASIAHAFIAARILIATDELSWEYGRLLEQCDSHFGSLNSATSAAASPSASATQRLQRKLHVCLAFLVRPRPERVPYDVWRIVMGFLPPKERKLLSRTSAYWADLVAKCSTVKP